MPSSPNNSHLLECLLEYLVRFKIPSIINVPGFKTWLRMKRLPGKIAGAVPSISEWRKDENISQFILRKKFVFFLVSIKKSCPFYGCQLYFFNRHVYL